MKPFALFDNPEHSHKPSSPYLKGLIKGEEDYLQAQAFLLKHRNSVATYQAYRRELERFLHWCWLVRATTLPLVTSPDIHRFVEFCQNPPSSWCTSTKGVSRFIKVAGQRRPNPEWKPFLLRPKGELLSNRSVIEIYQCLTRFFDFCSIDRYVLLNPAKAAWREAKSIFYSNSEPSSPQVIREELWQAVIATLHKAAAEAPHLYERTLFIVSVMYGLYLRTSDLVTTDNYWLTMGNFYQDPAGHWLFRIELPNRPSRIIEVSDMVLGALKRYRLYLNLSSYPALNEETPLLTKQKGTGPLTDSSSLRKLVKHAFQLTSQQLKEQGKQELALELEKAQVKSLRNAGVTQSLNSMHPEQLRQEAGYRSMGSLGRYQMSTPAN